MASILAALQEPSQMVNPLLAQGVIGVCLIALAIWYILKDKKYENRINEMLKREREFQAAQADSAEKYRVAMEKFAQTLEVVLTLLKTGK